MMLKSIIEVDPETRKQSLTIYYDPVKDDFDRQIEWAMAFHGVVEGEMAIIALPDSMKTDEDLACSHIKKII
jgi:hypothetical protein